jgi:hypothetical protein
MAAMARLLDRVAVTALAHDSIVPAHSLSIDADPGPLEQFGASLLARVAGAATADGNLDLTQLEVRFIDADTRHRVHYTSPRRAGARGRDLLVLVNRDDHSPPWVHADGGWLGATFSFRPAALGAEAARVHGTRWDRCNRRAGDDAHNFRVAVPERTTLVITGDDRAERFTRLRREASLTSSPLYSTLHAPPDLIHPTQSLRQHGRYQYRVYVDARIAPSR